MRTITTLCIECNQNFEAPLKEIKRGNGKYCSRSCSGLATAKRLLAKSFIENQPNVLCSYCNVSFYMNTSKKKNSKSGLYFCCRKHKDLAQSIRYGLKEIHPAHYGVKESRYRLIAFRNKDIKCARCDYNSHPGILEVHHLDRDRDNNNIDNLIILCPNCHMTDHLLNKDGRWGRKFPKQVDLTGNDPAEDSLQMIPVSHTPNP